MDSRQRVSAALTFQHPDRAPRDIWALPYVTTIRKDEYQELISKYPPDVEGLSPTYPPDVQRPNGFHQIGNYIDEWGSVWYLAEPGVVGEVKEPALAEWKKLEHYCLPWHLIQKRDFSFLNSRCDQTEKFTLSEASVRIFERMQFLRGSQNLFIDIGYGTPEFRRLLEMLHEYYVLDLESWCNTNLDAICLMDDWGTNDRLLINPKTWRAIFKPIYREFCEIIHKAGKYVFFHSDGNIKSIYGDLIEIGMDAINSQLFTMDIEKLARDYKGKVTFWGEIDRQHILPFGSPQAVQQAVWRVRHALDDGKGGVFAQCEWGKYDPVENIETVFQTWLE